VKDAIVEHLTLHSAEANAQSGRLDLNTGTIRPMQRVIAEKTSRTSGLFGTTGLGATALYRYAHHLWLHNEALRLRLQPDMTARVAYADDASLLTLSLDGDLSLTLRCVPQHGVDFARLVAGVINDSCHYGALLDPPSRQRPPLRGPIATSGGRP
jgi:hypothetical protein